MNDFLVYLLKSTVSISVFYLLYSILMRRDTNFAVKRGLLLGLVVASLIVPLIQLPQIFQTAVKVELIPELSRNRIQPQSFPEAGQPALKQDYGSVVKPMAESNQLNFSPFDGLVYLYAGGVMLSFFLFAKSILLILLIFRKATVRKMDGYRLFIVNKEIPSFAFGHSIVISQSDYDAHCESILAHELSHIRLNHFGDLLLLEIISIFHWFNPVVYLLKKDMKEIHEFQADEYTLRSGVDVKQYQLLIIQKGVGRRRFALANSFNQCQIKKRIIMINELKTRKMAWWKAATFIPMLCLLLFACGRTGKTVNSETAGKAPESEQTSIELEGAWKYILSESTVKGNKIVRISQGSKYSEMKIWTKDYFAFVGDQGLGGYPFGGSGTYTLNGNLYEESVIYAPGLNPDSPKVKLRLEINKDTLTQIWPVDDAGKYDELNFNIIKMVRMK